MTNTLTRKEATPPEAPTHPRSPCRDTSPERRSLAKTCRESRTTAQAQNGPRIPRARSDDVPSPMAGLGDAPNSPLRRLRIAGGRAGSAMSLHHQTCDAIETSERVVVWRSPSHRVFSAVVGARPRPPPSGPVGSLRWGWRRSATLVRAGASHPPSVFVDRCLRPRPPPSGPSAVWSLCGVGGGRSRPRA